MFFDNKRHSRHPPESDILFDGPGSIRDDPERQSVGIVLLHFQERIGVQPVSRRDVAAFGRSVEKHDVYAEKMEVFQIFRVSAEWHGGETQDRFSVQGFAGPNRTETVKPERQLASGREDVGRNRI